jgi:hypothetical protein
LNRYFDLRLRFFARADGKISGEIGALVSDVVLTG